jgi:hypothetical protein
VAGETVATLPRENQRAGQDDSLSSAKARGARLLFAQSAPCLKVRNWQIVLINVLARGNEAILIHDGSPARKFDSKSAKLGFNSCVGATRCRLNQHNRSKADIDDGRRNVRFVPCVDGSGLASQNVTSHDHWSVQPCVRPVSAVRMTAGHNALRGSGPGQKPAFLVMHWH